MSPADPFIDDAPTRPLGILPGWFGKMPALGDFATRRIDEAFTTRWDAWLQQCMATTRNLLGDAEWAQAYVHAPPWHFVLMPGVVGEQAWAGAWVPSMDRVGRYFPLTACIQTRDARAVVGSIVDGESWHAQVAQVLQAAVGGETEIELFEQQLGACLFPLNHYLPDAAGRELLMAAAQSGRGRLGTATLPGALGPALTAAGLEVLTRDLAGKSLWWTPRDKGAATALLAQGLPTPGDFLALLQPQ